MHNLNRPNRALRLAAAFALAASGFLPSQALAQPIVSTAQAVADAPWAANVTITINGDVLRYQSNGLPDHPVPDQFVVPKDGNQPPFADDDDSNFVVVNTAEFLQSDPLDEMITLLPEYSDTPVDTPLGAIGVALSGARIFNDYESPQRDKAALDDNRTIGTASFVDACNAHPLQNGKDYHYHGVPLCITEVIDTPGEHSHLVGLLLDGFPIYGPQGQGGVGMTNADLDACSGHLEATPEFPGGIYHYHLTVDEAPYSIDCFHGKIDTARLQQDGPNGGPPDFAAVAESLGISEADLSEALGAAHPPDFEAAAQKLGISAERLRAAMPPPP